MLLSAGSLVAFGAVFLGAWITQKVVYAWFFSPLRDLPGPFLGRLTPLWLRFVDISGNRTTTIHRLHQLYGSTVLTSPNEISLSDITNVKTLYGQQTDFMEAPVYESMTMEPCGIFSMRYKTVHAQRRRLLSHACSQSNLQDCEPLIHKHINGLVQVIQNSVGQPIDMLNWFRLVAFDIVGELFPGQSFGGLEPGRTPQFLSDVELFFIVADLKWNNPWIVHLLSQMPLASIRHLMGAMQRLLDYAGKAFHLYIEQYGRHSGRKDLLTKILSLKIEAGDAQLTDRETSNEVGNLVFAGSDTTSTTLTFLFWELSKHPEWQCALREEPETCTDSSPTFQQAQELPILDAVINEALRLHPAAPASLPHETPAGGRVLNGHFIPEKTIASMQCYTTHRGPRVYPEPESFRPARLIDEQKVSNEMKEPFMPFSKGTRACLDKNLAVMELKLITATIIRRIKVAPSPSTTDVTMSMKDHFLLISVGGKCELIFESV